MEGYVGMGLGGCVRQPQTMRLDTRKGCWDKVERSWDFSSKKYVSPFFLRPASKEAGQKSG